MRRPSTWIIACLTAGVPAGVAIWQWSIHRTDIWLWAALALTGAATVASLIGIVVAGRNATDKRGS